MSSSARSRKLIDDFAGQVEAIKWGTPFSGERGGMGERVGFSEYVSSLERNIWEPGRYDAINRIREALSEQPIMNTWDPIVIEARETIRATLSGSLGMHLRSTTIDKRACKQILDRTRWDLMMYFMTTIFGSHGVGFYDEAFEKYICGWLVGGYYNAFWPSGSFVYSSLEGTLLH
jgi:hypothetical protein